ncbi:glycyl-tRNA synthetase [Rubritalea squalenifaciens DSM 18772]|uniref:glycine--tRNA ligase n=1 Tax=Rubritalea squalenifaciens DSM 18772 TaxID=1123071 RepID=A0A1M6IUP5_9BACT|nr:glycine--tRNA ligase [Rubritalea squalenifaciens]SHJ38152.1 glycyl-tRNA synthetase [Rubritalea squalenifaciens DSM 18772]
MADKENTDPQKMEKIVSLCKSKGFIYQSGELYGGLNGCWDYGPLGTELKRNLKEYWWRKNVQERDDILGMDGSILTHQAVLTASGHVGGFSDPMCDCLLSKARLRADQIDPQSGTAYHYTGASHEESGWSVERPFSVLLTDPNQDENKARKTAKEYYSQFLSDKQISPKKLSLQGETSSEEKDTTRYNPANGSLLTEPREFNLMFQTKMGASSDDSDPNAVAYLRPETAQTIFVQYKNVLDSSRVKLPFGIAQIGKAFRNEINPRNFTFRSREFEQMEIEYFCHPDDGLRLTDEWLEKRLCFYEEIGIPREKLHILDVPDGERAFYSEKTYDIEYEFPFGIQELEGVAYRTNYDLGVHQEHSKKTLEYFDEETKERFVPHVVEPSAGCDRTALALICEAYDVEDLTKDGGKKDERTVMRFKPCIAPIKAAILPLLKNKPELVEKAKEVKNLLQPFMNVFYDEAAAIGRRYRRQDEIGTPFCIAIDFQTLGEADEDGNDLTDTVTIRHRDSMEQERIAIKDLLPWLLERIR